MLDLIWVKTDWHSDSIPENFFKVNFVKYSTANKEACKVSKQAMGKSGDKIWKWASAWYFKLEDLKVLRRTWSP